MGSRDSSASFQLSENRMAEIPISVSDDISSDSMPSMKMRSTCSTSLLTRFMISPVERFS